jgi:hypothetical protein
MVGEEHKPELRIFTIQPVDGSAGRHDMSCPPADVATSNSVNNDAPETEMCARQCEKGGLNHAGCATKCVTKPYFRSTSVPAIMSCRACFFSVKAAMM